MKINRFKCNSYGITKIEVIVIIGVLILLCSVLAAWLAQPKYRMSEISCAGKLDRIGIAFEGYASEHREAYPMTVSVADGGTHEYTSSGYDTYRHFQIFSNTIALSEFLVCPQDNRRAAAKWVDMTNTNVSYFVGLDADNNKPNSILAGDRNVTSNSGTIITPRSGLKWVEGMGLHGASGHVLFADGHVKMLDSTALSNAIQQGENPTNRIAVP